MTEIKSLLKNTDNKDVLELHKSILKVFEDKYTKVLLYLQDGEKFVINVVEDDKSDLIEKIKTENLALKNFDIPSTKNHSREDKHKN